MADGRIAAADLHHHNRLKDALATACDQPDAPPADLDVVLEAGSGRLKLLPLPRGSIRGTLAPEAAAAIVLTGAQRPSQVLDHDAIAEQLVARHGLTRSEAGVALQIAKGDGRAAAAARLGIRENTVRTHLSAVFHKLEINRQAQLVRLIDEVAGAEGNAPAPIGRGRA